MNKGNLNKLVTNYPVELTEEEISNLSGTLAPVIAACGGGGGGTGGKIYTGIGFVNVNNTTNQIGLTNEANTKLNQDIPTKVSDLTDSANYQTVAGMDEYLTTANAQTLYQTKNDMSAYLTSANASSTYQTKEDMTAYLTTANANSDYAKKTLVETVSGNIVAKIPTKTSQLSNDKPFLIHQDMVNYGPGWMDLNDGLSTKQDTLTFGYDENNAISSIDNTPLAGQGGKTYSAGQYINIDANDTISVTGVVAIDNTSAYDPILLGDANITAVSSRTNNRTTWNLSVNATPVVTDTKLTGDNCVTAHTTETSGEWAVGLVQSAYQAIDSVGGIATDVGTLKTASGDWDKVSDKLDTTAFSTVSGSFLTSHQSLDNYYTKTQIDSTFASATQLNDYLTTATYQTDSGTFLTKSSADNDYAPKSVTATVNTLTGASASWNEVSAKLGTAQYANDSATFVTSSNSTITGTKQYALTTAGWAEVSTPTVPDITATSGISADGYTIGLTNTAIGAITSVSSKVDKPTSLNDKYLVLRTDSNGAVSGWCDFQDQSYSKSEALGTFVATANIDSTTLSGDGKSVSTKLGVKTDVIATIDYVSGNYLPTSGGTVSGDVIVKSTGKNLLAVNTTATLMGQSRVANLTDTTAIGTNWLGVNSLGGGFLKNVQGGNVGDLNGTSSIQINFASDGANSYGNITVNSQDNVSKVVHIPTASYNSMSSFDNTNGPNYMLRKTASGFDIGAAVINVTTLPAQTEANTYYFIYDT